MTVHCQRTTSRMLSLVVLKKTSENCERTFSRTFASGPGAKVLGNASSRMKSPGSKCFRQREGANLPGCDKAVIPVLFSTQFYRVAVHKLLLFTLLHLFHCSQCSKSE